MKVSELFEAKAAVKVTARKNPNGTHGPTGTFTVKAFEVDGDSVYVKISEDGGWGISLKTPPAFLKFTAANGMPITLKSAIEMMKPVKESLNEGFAIKLKSGSWYSDQRPSLGPLKGGNSQIRVFKSMSAADDFLIMQQNSKVGGKKFEDAEIKRAPKAVKEDCSKDLEDAILYNWMSLSNDEIVSKVKSLAMKGDKKFGVLRGKPGAEILSMVQDARDNVRNQVDEQVAGKGMWVIKNKDGKEKRFKDDESPQAVAWKASSTPKRNTGEKAEKYSEEWWTYKEFAEETVPWTRIEPMDDSDEVNRIIDDEFGKINTDWTYGKKSEVKRDDVPCAAVVVRVMYEITPDDDLGVEETTQDTQSILVARNPKNPKKLDFMKYVG